MNMQSAYPYLLSFHNFLRWIVLAAGLAATIIAASGWSGTKTTNVPLRRFSVIFVASMDLQFLLGLVLYFFASPIVHPALQNMSAAIKLHELRLFAADHTTAMFIAILLAHSVGAVARK